MASPTLFPDSGPNTDRIQVSFFPQELRRQDDFNRPRRMALRQTPIKTITTGALFTTSANYGLPQPFP